MKYYYIKGFKSWDGERLLITDGEIVKDLYVLRTVDRKSKFIRWKDCINVENDADYFQKLQHLHLKYWNEKYWIIKEFSTVDVFIELL